MVLQKRLPVLNVVRETPKVDKVFFGATVEVCDADDNSNTYRIVGPDETDASTNAISMDSPLAKALLGKQVDDELMFAAGGSTSLLSIVSIHYRSER